MDSAVVNPKVIDIINQDATGALRNISTIATTATGVHGLRLLPD